jgi:cytochrome c peroxidase
VYRTLAADRVYQLLFAAAFPGESTPVTTPNVAAALSAFERSIVSFRSPFDRYREYEDRTAMSESAMRGSVLFFSNRKARCISCHRGLNLDGGSKTVNTPPAEELVFTFHNTGLYNLGGCRIHPTTRGCTSRPGGRRTSASFACRHCATSRSPPRTCTTAASPRWTRPSITTWPAAARRILKSTGLQPLTLTLDERKDLIAFLESLTDREALGDPRWSDPWK